MGEVECGPGVDEHLRAVLQMAADRLGLALSAVAQEGGVAIQKVGPLGGDLGAAWIGNRNAVRAYFWLRSYGVARERVALGPVGQRLNGTGKDCSQRLWLAR